MGFLYLPLQTKPLIFLGQQRINLFFCLLIRHPLIYLAGHLAAAYASTP